jgi:hypothetical protein
MDITCQRCGLVNDYAERQSGPHTTAYCNGCGNYIKHLQKNEPIKLYFGKYKDRELSSMTSDEELKYLIWLSQAPGLKAKLKTAIDNHIKRS